MAMRNRDACSSQWRRTPNHCDGRSPGEAGYVAASLGEGLENQNTVYHNVILLADSLAIGEPYKSVVDEMGEGIQFRQADYSAELYVDKATGKIDAVDFDGSVDPEIARAKTLAKIMLRATIGEEITAQVEDGFQSTALGLELDAALTDRARHNLDETLARYEEQ